MSTEIAVQQNDIVALINGHVVTTSNRIAEVFGKRHGNVLRDIDNLLPQLPEGCKLNFELSSETLAIPNGGTREQRKFTLTKDGFTLLAMGFTGPKAMEFKIGYINAFNAMESEIKRLQAENEALLKAQLTNCHKAMHNLKVDNRLDVVIAELPLEEVRLRERVLNKEKDLIEKENEKLRLKIQAKEATAEAKRLDLECAYAWMRKRQMESEDEREKKERTNRRRSALEIRLAALERVLGIGREDAVPEALS